MSKRFYWLKLERQFFKRHDIQLLRAENREYVEIYLELMAESIDHDGTLRFSEKKPYTNEQLSTLIHCDGTIFEKAMAAFEENELIEWDENGTLHVTLVTLRVGSQAESTERVRKYRGKQREKQRDPEDPVLESPLHVTIGNENVTQSIESREQSLELDKNSSSATSSRQSEREDVAREKNFLPALKAHAPNIEPPPDPVLVAYRKGMEHHLPSTSWTEHGKQSKALGDLTARTKILAPGSAIIDPVKFAGAILDVFERRKSSGRGEFWRDAPWDPVTIHRRFPELVTGLSDAHEADQKEAADLAVMEELYGKAD